MTEAEYGALFRFFDLHQVIFHEQVNTMIPGKDIRTHPSLDINSIAISKELTMRKNTVVFSLVVTALLASFGMSRAVAQDAEHDHQHQATSTGSSDKKAKSVAGKSAGKPEEAANHGGMMDMKAMCDMHREMMSKGSSSEREAMVDKEMKGMSAEQKQQHMKMMDEQCK